MRSILSQRKKIILSAFTAALFTPNFLHAANLSLGADYMLRGVATTERDKTIKSSRYYDQRLQGYLTTDLSKDVEASIRIQSITPWGLEGSSTPLVTRYPQANGGLWVQNAYARLPHIWNDRIILTVGRQPIQWGDGRILSDDELGFNAIRVQVKSPWRRLPFDVEGFTAKVKEGLSQPGDKDLHGGMLSFDSRVFRWDLMGLWEKSDGVEAYEMGSDTTTALASKIERQIYGARAITRLKDAYIKGEYYIQQGNVRRSPNGAEDIKLGGSAYVVGLGGKQNTEKLGRFGAVAEYSSATGDTPSTKGEDEAFRPTYASRWSGLERSGYGQYFAATFSDAYSPTQPFAPVDSTNTGLPPGTSGIQSIHFGLESTPWSQWTFSLDYFQYKADKRVSGPKDLGSEFDYAFLYRYSGLVTVRGSYVTFEPGEAFDNPDPTSATTFVSTKTKASRSSIELVLKF